MLQIAQRTLERDAMKLDEVRELKTASTAQHKKVESLVYKLVAESDDEGKILIEKMKVLEARLAELKKQKS